MRYYKTLPVLEGGDANHYSDHLMYHGHLIGAHTLIDLSKDYDIELSYNDALGLIKGAHRAVAAGLTSESKATEHILDTLFADQDSVKISFAHMQQATAELAGLAASLVRTLQNHTTPVKVSESTIK